jgi:hypothetical protein
VRTFLFGLLTLVFSGLVFASGQSNAFRQSHFATPAGLEHIEEEKLRTTFFFRELNASLQGRQQLRLNSTRPISTQDRPLLYNETVRTTSVWVSQSEQSLSSALHCVYAMLHSLMDTSYNTRVRGLEEANLLYRFIHYQ